MVNLANANRKCQLKYYQRKEKEPPSFSLNQIVWCFDWDLLGLQMTATTVKVVHGRNTDRHWPESGVSDKFTLWENLLKVL